MPVTLERKHTFWLLGFEILVCLALALSGSNAAQATEADFEARAVRSPRSATLGSALKVALPFQFRARLAGLYMRDGHVIDSLAYDALTSPGPALRSQSLFESRFSIGRPIWKNLELEIAWASRNEVSVSDLVGFGRQTVGAFIRFTH
jgi:hypothetical protein